MKLLSIQDGAFIINLEYMVEAKREDEDEYTILLENGEEYTLEGEDVEAFLKIVKG